MNFLKLASQNTLQELVKTADLHYVVSVGSSGHRCFTLSSVADPFPSPTRPQKEGKGSATPDDTLPIQVYAWLGVPDVRDKLDGDLDGKHSLTVCLSF